MDPAKSHSAACYPAARESNTMHTAVECERRSTPLPGRPKHSLLSLLSPPSRPSLLSPLSSLPPPGGGRQAFRLAAPSMPSLSLLDTFSSLSPPSSLSWDYIRNSVVNLTRVTKKEVCHHYCVVIACVDIVRFVKKIVVCGVPKQHTVQVQIGRAFYFVVQTALKQE